MVSLTAITCTCSTTDSQRLCEKFVIHAQGTGRDSRCESFFGTSRQGPARLAPGFSHGAAIGLAAPARAFGRQRVTILRPKFPATSSSDKDGCAPGPAPRPFESYSLIFAELAQDRFRLHEHGPRPRSSGTGIAGSRRRSPEQRYSSIRECGQVIISRSIRLRSSRTLPGQLYRASTARAASLMSFGLRP